MGANTSASSYLYIYYTSIVTLLSSNITYNTYVTVSSPINADIAVQRPPPTISVTRSSPSFSSNVVLTLRFRRDETRDIINRSAI